MSSNISPTHSLHHSEAINRNQISRECSEQGGHRIGSGWNQQSDQEIARFKEDNGKTQPTYMGCTIAKGRKAKNGGDCLART